MRGAVDVLAAVGEGRVREGDLDRRRLRALADRDDRAGERVVCDRVGREVERAEPALEFGRRPRRSKTFVKPMFDDAASISALVMTPFFPASRIV